MAEAFCRYDDQTDIVVKVKRASKEEALAAICIVLHINGEMSVAGPLDDAKLVGNMFEGAWQVIKQIAHEKKKLAFVEHQIEEATNEALKSLGVKGLRI